MNGSFPIGRFRGIRIFVHWSAVLTGILVAYLFATGISSDQSAPVEWLVAGVTAVLFWAALLAHELAHAVVARRHGVRVRDVTLWFLGGVTVFENEPNDPGSQLRISAAGPLTSLTCGIGFVVLGLVARLLDAPHLLVLAAIWLGVTNVAIGFFNLIPAAPLDGGRVLQALLWRRSGNRRRASLTAARAGVIAGTAVAVLGLVELLLSTNLLNGVWLIMIGIFLISSARAEKAVAAAGNPYGDATVADVPRQDQPAVPADLSITRLIADYLVQYGKSEFPVRDLDDRIIGIVTFDQIVAVPEARQGRTTTRQIMWPRAELIRTDLHEPIAHLIPRITAGPVNAAIVFDGDRPVGVITRSDILRALQPPASSTDRPA
ncbi:MAG TPA: site-2 protease family protein [Mycobacteriales bacterium]|nr:site-2 protease family protein [Mycobacteriales bacterium]